MADLNSRPENIRKVAEASLNKLSVEELVEIEAASAQIKVMGTQYPEQMERSTGL